jgi:tetratricopeptide (TPR) repeat protein
VKRSLLILVLLAVTVTAVSGYVAWRRDGQYRTYIADGDEAVQREDSFGAIEAFSGAIALRPSSMLAWLKRGEVYLARNDQRSAIRDLRQAIALDAAAPRPLELLGDAQAALERYGIAADQYEAYLRLDDRDARMLYKLGLVRMYEGRLDLAVTALTRALRLNDQMPQAHYLLGICLAGQQRGPESIRALERAVYLAPAMIEARQALAERYRRAGRVTDEVRQLEAVAALDAGHHGHYIAVADAWAHAGRSDLAVTTLVRAIERFSDDADLLVALGRVWLGVAESQGDRLALEKGLEALRQAVGRAPSGPALGLLGRAQLLSGDHAGALRSLQQATSALPVDPRALGDLATAAERLGRVSVARDALVKQDVLVGQAAAPRTRVDRAIRIANLCERQGDLAGAVTWLQHAAALDLDDHRLAARIARLKAQGQRLKVSG